MIAKAADEKKLVLVVDDEPNVVKYLETLLRDHGYNTVSARNGKEAFTKAQQLHPDLVCLDITMPEESGIRCYRRIREDPALASVPVVVVTAVTAHGGDPEPFKRFLSTRRQVSPPEAFFSKPIDRDLFLGKVAELLS